MTIISTVVNLLLPASRMGEIKNNSDYIFTLEKPIVAPVNNTFILQNININGNRSCYTISKKIDFTVLVNGAIKSSISIEPKNWNSNDLIKIITGIDLSAGSITNQTSTTGINIKEGFNQLVADDVTKSLQLQFNSNDFKIIAALLGLPGAFDSTGIGSYNVPSNGLFPGNFLTDLFSTSEIQLGFSATVSSETIPISIKCRESFQIGLGRNEPIVLPSVGSMPLGYLPNNLNTIKQIRVRLATSDYDLLPRFLYNLSINLLITSKF